MKVGAYLSSNWGSWGRRFWSLKSAWVTYYKRSYFKKQDKTNKQTKTSRGNEELPNVSSVADRTREHLFSQRWNLHHWHPRLAPLPPPTMYPEDMLCKSCMLKAICEFFKLPSWDATANIRYILSSQYSFAGDSQEPYVNFIDLKENHRDSVYLLNIILDLQLKSHVCSVSLGTASSSLEKPLHFLIDVEDTRNLSGRKVWSRGRVYWSPAFSWVSHHHQATSASCIFPLETVLTMNAQLHSTFQLSWHNPAGANL